MIFSSRCFAVASPGLCPCPPVGNDTSSSPPPPKPTVLRCSRNLPWCRPPPASSSSAHRLAQPVYSATGRLTHVNGNSRNPFLFCCFDGVFSSCWYSNTTVIVTQLALRPWQVTKKRVSANKKNQETQEFYSAAHAAARHQSQRGQNQPAGQSQAQSGKVDKPHQHATDSNTSSSSPGPADAASTMAAAPHTPPRQNMPATGHTPGSASKRKHRKLAVNFEAAKVSEWWAGACVCEVCPVFLSCCLKPDSASVIQTSSMWTFLFHSTFNPRRSSFSWDEGHRENFLFFFF